MAKIKGSPFHFLISSIMFQQLILLIYSLFIMHSFAYDIQNMDDAMQYLSRFGYMGKDTATHYNLIDTSDVIREFQKMAGINETGELNSETMNMMNAPRCGNKDMDHEMIPDIDEQVDNNLKDRLLLVRRKRFKLNQYNAKWRKRDLTYNIPKFSSKVKVAPELIERDVENAFRLWEAVTNLNFIKSRDNKVDIELDFAQMRHHDDYPFDGPGKTLAHAFPPGPGLGGDVHFDDSESWSVDSPRGTNILFVAVHEIGHALGLSHSDKKGAIMQAFYGGYRPMLQLHEDDIAGIQSIYGKRDIPLPNPTRGPGPQFGSRFSPATTKPTFPINRLIPIINQWNKVIEIPASSYESMVNKNNDDSFFNARRVNSQITTTSAPWWRSSTARTTTTALTTTRTPWWKTTATTTPFPPKPTTNSFFSSPSSGSGSADESISRPDLCVDSKIDAITTLNDGRIYVFKDNYVFALDERNGGIASGWPSRIEFKFNGLNEGKLNAALTRPNGKTFFFKGGKYWRFTGFKIDSFLYPRSISKHFPGIPDYIDAAFENPKTKQMYFMKGDKLWRFDPFPTAGGQHVSDIYPISITAWGLPISGIDAALVSPTGAIYFFKDDNYWKFNLSTFKVEDANPPYPRSVKEFWFGCTNKKINFRNLRQNNYFYHNEIYN